MSNGRLTLVMPTGKVLHVRLTFAHIFHEFATGHTSSTKIQRKGQQQHFQLVTQCFTCAPMMRRLSDEANLIFVTCLFFLCRLGL